MKHNGSDPLWSRWQPHDFYSIGIMYISLLQKQVGRYNPCKAATTCKAIFWSTTVLQRGNPLIALGSHQEGHLIYVSASWGGVPIGNVLLSHTPTRGIWQVTNWQRERSASRNRWNTFQLSSNTWCREPRWDRVRVSMPSSSFASLPLQVRSSILQVGSSIVCEAPVQAVMERDTR